MIRVPMLLPLALILLVVGCGVYAWHLRAELSEANAQIEGYKEAARQLDAHIRVVEEQRRYWQDAATALQDIEGADETLNPYLRAVLDCVRQGNCHP